MSHLNPDWSVTGDCLYIDPRIQVWIDGSATPVGVSAVNDIMELKIDHTEGYCGMCNDYPYIGYINGFVWSNVMKCDKV